MSRGATALAVLVLVSGPGAADARAEVIEVPGDHPTIQAAIDAAATGDLVLVSRGTWAGGLVVSGKTITLASMQIVTGDAADVLGTIVTGGDPMLRIDASAADTTVQGLTFQSGGYGLVNRASRATIVNNRFLSTGDAVSFETAGGIVRGNFFQGSSDDAIDLDYSSFDVTLEGNVIVGAGDDGIEIRLHDYGGPLITILIRNNAISGCAEDGIQLIDYAGLSNRRLRIERNVVTGNAKAGLGCMANGNSSENLAGAPLAEEVQVINNTFSGNPVAITGGDTMLVLNNIIANSSQVGLKRASAASLAAYNDFWNNGANYSNSNVDVATTLVQDPLLAPNHGLLPGSPCVDAGAATFRWNGAPVAAPSYSGPAPDLGGKESPSATPANVLTVGGGGHFADIQSALDAAWAPYTIVSVAPGVYPAFTIGETAPYGLRVSGNGAGTVAIDTTLQPVLVFGLPASGAVELADLTVGSGATGGVGLAVAWCAGLVLIDELAVQGGSGQAGLQVMASARVAIQRSDLGGAPGLRLNGASKAIASRGTLDEFDLAGGSALTTCQLAASGTVGAGSTHTALAGVMPSVTMPRFVPLATPFTITLEGTPSQPAFLAASIPLGFVLSPNPKLEMALIAKLPGGLFLPLGAFPAGGSLPLTASLPLDEALLGVPLVVQIITKDSGANSYRFGHAATVVGMP
ncbi:MAG TPA: right-handed parallel beta-helix repeat-containing protein [Planctomycetota bacterium]|nr:right-handed parallel beta-helix repeat-containing protein [Planctomycetota bacterium]